MSFVERAIEPAVLTGYREGERFFLDPPSECAEALAIALVPGVRVSLSQYGERLLFREHVPYGMRLTAALSLGWCRLAETVEPAPHA